MFEYFTFGLLCSCPLLWCPIVILPLLLSSLWFYPCFWKRSLSLPLLCEQQVTMSNGLSKDKFAHVKLPLLILMHCEFTSILTYILDIILTNNLRYQTQSNEHTFDSWANIYNSGQMNPWRQDAGPHGALAARSTARRACPLERAGSWLLGAAPVALSRGARKG
jgi:hypothetical protein